MRQRFLYLAFSFGVAWGSAAAPIELIEGDVVAFAGGTDMVRMQKAGTFEAALSEQFAEAAPKFRDLAWEGDTVYFQGTVGQRWRKEAFGGWGQQLERVGATVVIAQFGKIESLDGVSRLADFVEAYGKLLDEFGAHGRRVILLEPGDLDWGWADAGALPEYRRAVAALADGRGCAYVRGDPLASLGAPQPGTVAAVREKHRLWYDYWRPANWKCLFGDDSKRIFSNAAEGLPSFREEWETYPDLIAAAEAMITRGEIPQPRPTPKRTGSAEADITKELAGFEVLGGYEVNLFADERLGIANPLSIRWDADGRAFVACSDVYPQIEPGVMPDDKVIALRDLDGDGAADESTVFADRLNIPTGMEVGAHGLYVAGNTELWHLGWDGTRELLLSGFGNGDSHQTSNGFAWSPGGDLWFCQGDGIESRVETPYGVSSLFQAGVFRLRPAQLRLDPLLDDFMGPGNPWGVAFDEFGQSFVIDGAGGISYLTPGSIPAQRRLRLPRIGDPGGYCGIDDLGDGSFGVGDYKKNQVTRFRALEDGAGFKVEFIEPLLRSRHRNFRPVDVKLGPDGAIYVVDWYNPITCHQDDFYRHPARDKTHGRIWRVARKGSDSHPPALPNLAVAELVEALKSDHRWTRTKAKQLLAARGLKAVPPAVREWQGRDLLEAVGLATWCGIVDRPLLGRLLDSADHRCRSYAARIAGRWGCYDLLERAASDDHPRVRMEAVLAAGQIPEARAVLIAASVAEGARDRWIDYAFSQAVNHLKRHWVPAFKRGELDFGDRRRGAAAVLEGAGDKGLLSEIREVLGGGDLERPSRVALLKALLAAGDPGDLRLALDLKPPSPVLLAALAEHQRPDFDVSHYLLSASASPDGATAASSFDLAAAWSVEELYDQASAAVSEPASDGARRAAAIRAIGSLGGGRGAVQLESIVRRDDDPHQAAAVAALLRIDPRRGAAVAAELLRRPLEQGVLKEVFAGIVACEGAASQVAAAMASGGAFATGQGERLRTAWIATGLVEESLARQLEALAGGRAADWEYSDDLVRRLAAAGREGDRQRGQALFASPRLGCIACHRVAGVGGEIGPDLSALGSGVPPERIATEVLFPARQVKEGFSLTRVTTSAGTVLQGYEQDSRERGRVRLRDFATGHIHEFEVGEIAKKEAVGSLMPPTAQALSWGEIADLLCYLYGLDGRGG